MITITQIFFKADFVNNCNREGPKAERYVTWYGEISSKAVIFGMRVKYGVWGNSPRKMEIRPTGGVLAILRVISYGIQYTAVYGIRYTVYVRFVRNVNVKYRMYFIRFDNVQKLNANINIHLI